MHSLTVNKIRVQVLSENIIRLEKTFKGGFSDEATFLIPGKKSFEGCEFNLTEKDGYKVISFCGYSVFIPEGGAALNGIYVTDGNGAVIYRYKRIKNTGELPSLEKTPEAFPVSDTPRIYVPEGGYTYRGEVKDGGYVIEENTEDVYLLLCGKNAKKLRKLYVELTGRNELVRLSALGSWNSKYFAYDEKTAKQLISDYEKYNVPLDNMVLDTDWRAASDRGIGYDVNNKLFPDMSGFLSFAHEHGVEIMFNDHPEPVDGADSVLSPSEVKYREEKLQSLMEKDWIRGGMTET